jgi:hypothetical protein
MSFVLAMKDYFGLKEGETAMGFMQEMRALSDDDKKWFRENLPSVGYKIVDAVH